MLEEYFNEHLKMVVPCLKILVGTLVLIGACKFLSNKGATKK